MIRVISANVNGIRAAGRKGFFDWLNTQNADFVCLQETKAQIHQLTDELYHPAGYHCFYQDAEKKGYSGVALYSRTKPKAVSRLLGWPVADTEGRFLQVDTDNVSIISLYLPSGSSGDERQNIKFDFLDHFYKTLQKWKRSKRSFIICGDWNIVHKRIDITNWTSNQKTSGCLPEERAWLDTIFTKLGFVDAFRVVNQDEKQYTWWSNRGRAWDNNVGWRIDYQITTPDLTPTIQHAHIYKEERFSDHAPLIIDYDI